jgi:hypothetical protein
MKLDFTYNVELDYAHLLAFDFSDAGVKLSRRRSGLAKIRDIAYRYELMPES